MSLRGSVPDFPLETVVTLVNATSKTGQLELRGAEGSGTLGFAEGRLVSAVSGDDVGEPALGAIFAIAAGDFEFVPWNEAPNANLSGSLDQLLERAAVERDRIVADREVIPTDRTRFTLSQRAASKGEITLTADQWKTLLAVNGDRDLTAIGAQLGIGRLATLALLAELVRSGMLDTLEPKPEPEPAPRPEIAPPEPFFPPVTAPTAWEQRAPEPLTWPPPVSQWEEPATASSWEQPAAPSAWPEPAPAPSWDPTPPAAAPTWDTTSASGAESLERPVEGTPSLAQRLAAMGDLPTAQPAEADERLSALSGIFGPAPTPAAAPPASDALSSFAAQDDLETVIPAGPTETAAAQAPKPKKSGLFGRIRKEEAPQGAAAEASLHVVPWSRAGQLGSFANTLLDEYGTGQYGKGRIDDRMTNLLMRVDEQADPIDRPLPVIDDRIDVQALERADMLESQAVPYLAHLVAQIHGDAEKAFGRDKAKKGYVAARQRIFGNDTTALASPDVVGKLPRV